MAANFSDALSAFALGPLDKAGGTNFQASMLEDARAKDRFTFQQRALQDQMEKDRKRQKEERTLSRRRLLESMQAVGAVGADTVVASGGVDALANLDDSDFGVFMSQASEQQMRRLSDKDLITATKGRLAARGLPIPEGEMSRDEAIRLNAQWDTEHLLVEEGKRGRAEAFQSFTSRLEGFNSEIHAATLNPLNVTATTLDNLENRLGILTAQLANEDLDKPQREALAARLAPLQSLIAAYRPQVSANTIGNSETPDQFRLYAKLAAEDPQAAELAKQHPGMADATVTLNNNWKALRNMKEEDARAFGVSEAWAYANGADSVGELMRDAGAAYSVFGVKAAELAVRLKDKEKRDALVENVGASIGSLQTTLRSYGPVFGNVADAYDALDKESLITGTPEHPQVNEAAMFQPLADAFQTAVDRATLPGHEAELYDLRTALDGMSRLEDGLGRSIAARLDPMLKSAEREVFTARYSEASQRPIEMGEKLRLKGMEKFSLGANGLLVRTTGTKSGLALNATALGMLSDGAVQVLRGDSQVTGDWIKAREGKLRDLEELANTSGNKTLQDSVKAAATTLADDAHDHEVTALAETVVHGSMKALRESVLAGGDDQEVAERVATQLTGVVGRQFQTVGMVDTAPDMVAEAILSYKTADNTMADAVLKYLEGNNDWILSAAEQRAQRSDLKTALTEVTKDWEDIVAGLPELEEVSNHDLRKLLEAQGVKVERSSSKPKDMLVAFIAGKL